MKILTMKLTINKKISGVFFLLVFSILLFGLANNVFAVTETETVQYRFLPFEDQGGIVDDGDGGTTIDDGGTTIDDGDTTTPSVTPGDTATITQSVTFHYVYNGDSSLHPGYRPIDCYSVEPSGLRCDIDLGFKSNITPMSCDNVWGNKRMDIDIGSPTGDVYVYWEADECDYNMPYEITGSGSVAIVGGSSTITSSGDLYCKGGTPSTTNCSPSNGWETGSCPASYFCPGYGQGVSGDSTTNEGSTQTVTFSKAVTKVPQVTVFGKDNGGVEHTGSMTVQSATNGEKNVEIYWKSWDVTRCDCTWTGGGCGFGVSPTPNELVPASGSFSNGGFSLTSDSTFTVKCD